MGQKLADQLSPHHIPLGLRLNSESGCEVFVSLVGLERSVQDSHGYYDQISLGPARQRGLGIERYRLSGHAESVFVLPVSFRKPQAARLIRVAGEGDLGGCTGIPPRLSVVCERTLDLNWGMLDR